MMRYYLHLYRQLRRKGWTREAAHRRARSHALVMETLALREEQHDAHYRLAFDRMAKSWDDMPQREVRA